MFTAADTEVKQCSDRRGGSENDNYFSFEGQLSDVFVSA